MSAPRPKSFRSRLFAAFLAVSLIPLVICSAMLLQIFRLRLTDQAQTQAREGLQGALEALDTACQGFDRALEQLEGNSVVIRALEEGQEEDTLVYACLFAATEGVRESARFDLYDGEGRWCYSTQSTPLQRQMSTRWGVLQRAGDELVFSATLDPADSTAPLLQGAAALNGPHGEQVGYLVVSLYQEDLRQLLENKYGGQGNLMLLSAYWRPVYCAQPSLTVSLAPLLRERLLSGESLDGAGGDYFYTVEHHPATGLYLVLQRPQVFTRDTMSLLYTVSLSCALICVGLSVLLSLKLSRQMFRPIQRLHAAIGEVVHNNLDVYVSPGENDELGELAQRFNGMVVALKRNQEELVENEKELNQAQIRMLQAQLNPHFLCNTLDTMKWISKINKVPQVALMSTNLADILRFCISPEEFVPLRRETEILRRYMEIQKIRLSGEITFQVEVPEELEDHLGHQAVLQPLVENAILHGLEGVEQGHIRVTAREEPEGVLHIEVADNGRGLPREMLGAYASRDRELSRGHLGLYNVDTILLKYYGAGFGLYLDDRPKGPGAVVTAAIPLHREEEEGC